jgi:tellurite resistance protein
MYFFAVFLFFLLVFQWRMFKSAEFFISWWAYSFPIAALTVATVLLSTYSDAGWVVPLAWALVAILTALMIVLLTLTIRAALRREICRPE